MTKITGHIDEKKFNRIIRRLATNARNTAPLMREISQDMLDNVEENFDRQGRPSWKPLRPSTIAQREALGKAGKILQRDGHLAKSVSTNYDRTSASVGTNLIYAGVHEFGHTFPAMRPRRKKALAFIGADGKKVVRKSVGPRRVPARPFLRQTEGDMSEHRKKILRWLLLGRSF